MKQSSPRQRKNCLQNFDLSEHRQILSDLAIHIYHQFITVMERNLTPAVGTVVGQRRRLTSGSESLNRVFRARFATVPGMLEHESLQGISSMKPSGFRKRSNSLYEDSDTHTISSIIQQLSVFHSTMSQHGMEPGLINQAVKQLFYLVGAVALNNIMLRKDMCSCRKGMQIRWVSVRLGASGSAPAGGSCSLASLPRCNISYLEEWLKDRNLQGSSAISTLGPLSQAAWLLQVNKSTDGDAKEIAEGCTELKPVQVPDGWRGRRSERAGGLTLPDICPCRS